MQGNAGGGFSVDLPYVWQYNENFTHTVYVNGSSFAENSLFGFVVDGHFARVNITYSKFLQNTCYKGVLALKGMEKEFFIYDNEILGNTGTYVVEFDTDSQSHILGSVSAYFEYNRVQENRHVLHARASQSRAYQPESYTIAVRGLQKVNITHNLLGGNEMDYELLAGLFTSRIDNYLNAEANWWGSSDPQVIEERIFDFDDWNNYALADYLPYLTGDSLRAAVSIVRTTSIEAQTINLDALGGRLTEDLRLPKRATPYTVVSDLTVMPGVTLLVEPGAVLEFYPSVGVLVLGRLEARGRKDDRIVFRPVDTSTASQYRWVEFVLLFLCLFFITIIAL